MEIDVTAALQLVQQVPGLLDVPSRTIEDNVRVSEQKTAQGHTTPATDRGASHTEPHMQAEHLEHIMYSMIIFCIPEPSMFLHRTVDRHR